MRYVVLLLVVLLASDTAHCEEICDQICELTDDFLDQVFTLLPSELQIFPVVQTAWTAVCHTICPCVERCASNSTQAPGVLSSIILAAGRFLCSSKDEFCQKVFCGVACITNSLYIPGLDTLTALVSGVSNLLLGLTKSIPALSELLAPVTGLLNSTSGLWAPVTGLLNSTSKLLTPVTELLNPASGSDRDTSSIIQAAIDAAAKTTGTAKANDAASGNQAVKPASSAPQSPANAGSTKLNSNPVTKSSGFLINLGG
ncbi:hypothetical protein BsWGS_22129 [Bradybaena similaris]